MNITQSTIPNIPPYSPDLGKDIIEYATRNNIPVIDMVNYYCQIYITFSEVEEVKVSLVADQEIENYQKIRFHLKTKSSVDAVLEKEAEFNKIIRKTIPRGSRTHFVLTPQII